MEYSVETMISPSNERTFVRVFYGSYLWIFSSVSLPLFAFPEHRILKISTTATVLVFNLRE